MRDETTIFNDLEVLARSPGFIHAIALICFRDNVVSIDFGGQLDPDDVRTLSDGWLLRSELSTLIGLIFKGPIDFSKSDPRTIENYVTRAEALLEELHEQLKEPMVRDIQARMRGEASTVSLGEMFREAIFYGGESAYAFQYRDLSVLRYAADDDWLVRNKGFSIREGARLASAITKLHNLQLTLAVGDPDDAKTFDDYLQSLMIDVTQLAEFSGLNTEVVENFLRAFAPEEGERNDGFKSISDLNIANLRPLVRYDARTFIAFHPYSIAEALYESPAYWLSADAAYTETANTNRGDFTEQFAFDRLTSVFGGNVYRNAHIWASPLREAGEADCLVVFGDRVLILQAKSKRLTLGARRGELKILEEDFAKGVQRAYEQGLACAKALLAGPDRVVDGDGQRVVLAHTPKEIYIVCLLADHYPALSFQAMQFLKTETTDVIRTPFVMDVFTLDVLAEMLSTPLHFLSYVNRRTTYADRVLATHELTVLAYHLRLNLWLEGLDFINIADDISAELDAAMMVRREGIPGNPTVDGILTRYDATSFGDLVRQLCAHAAPATLDVGFMLLTLGDESVRALSGGIDSGIARALANGDSDFSMAFGDSEGITIHFNDHADADAQAALERHCSLRKYCERSESWSGLCISPTSRRVRFGGHVKSPWVQDAQLDELTRDFKRSGPRRRAYPNTERNAPCPCGSGKRYRRCCLPR
jgi:hypothetical protein